MSLLTIVRNFCNRVNLPSPATVYGSTDSQIVQLRAILEEEGNDLSSRYSWQGITFEASHTSLAAEDQGAIATIASNGFRYIKNGTFWDRTDQIRILGPLDDKEWQQAKAMAPTVIGMFSEPGGATAAKMAGSIAVMVVPMFWLIAMAETRVRVGNSSG